MKPKREGKRRRHDDHEWLSSQTNKQRETKRNKQTIAFEEVHYGAGISRVYNGYLKSGSKQKSEKQTTVLEELKRKEERLERKLHRSSKETSEFVNQGRERRSLRLAHRHTSSVRLLTGYCQKKRMRFSGVYM